jgi:hypothetical protein
VSDTYLWPCAISLQIKVFIFVSDLFISLFFKGIVFLSIQSGVGRPQNWSGHFGEEKNVFPFPGIKL